MYAPSSILDTKLLFMSVVSSSVLPAQSCPNFFSRGRVELETALDWL